MKKNFKRSCFLLVTGMLSLFSSGIAHAQPARLHPERFLPGEKIIYDIKKLGLKAGTATIHYQGLVSENNRPLLLVVFTAEALNFYDQEKIFFDPVTFFPVKIERDVDIWGKKEKITERYSVQKGKGKVDIVKEAGDKTTDMAIRKENVLDNIYTFIYRYRKEGDFKRDEALFLCLPTKDVSLRLKGKKVIKIDSDKVDTFYMESEPKKYKIWFTVDQRRIPVRIDGAVGLGHTSMILADYQQGGILPPK